MRLGFGILMDREKLADGFGLLVVCWWFAIVPRFLVDRSDFYIKKLTNGNSFNGNAGFADAFELLPCDALKSRCLVDFVANLWLQY